MARTPQTVHVRVDIDNMPEVKARVEEMIAEATDSLLAERDALAATLKRIENLWREWMYGENSASAVEPGIAYCADQLGNALGDYHADTATTPEAPDA